MVWDVWDVWDGLGCMGWSGMHGMVWLLHHSFHPKLGRVPSLEVHNFVQNFVLRCFLTCRIRFGVHVPASRSTLLSGNVLAQGCCVSFRPPLPIVRHRRRRCTRIPGRNLVPAGRGGPLRNVLRGLKYNLENPALFRTISSIKVAAVLHTHNSVLLVRVKCFVDREKVKIGKLRYIPCCVSREG